MLNDMKIKSRLLLLMAALITLLVAIGGFGVYEANRAASSMDSLYLDRVLPLEQIAFVKERVLHNRMALTNAVLHPESAEKYAKEVAENNELIHKNIALYMDSYMDSDEKSVADQMVALANRYTEEAIKPALEAMKRGDTEQLKGLLVEKVRPLYYEMRGPLDKLLTIQREEAKKLMDTEDAEASLMGKVSMGLIVAGALIGGLLGFSIVSGIDKSVNEMRGVMSKMASNGDLTARVQVYGKDEIGEAAVAFNGLIDGFANIIRQVNTNAASVSSAAVNLSSASLQISQGSQAQSEAAASTAAAVEEITVSINSVASNTSDVRKLSEQSLRQTQQGNKDVTSMIGEIQSVQAAVNQIAGSVKEFVDSTRAIAGMTQQVKDIADQTNLLALNAAIEAARG